MAPPTRDRSDYWELVGATRPRRFFLSLDELLPDATTIFLEGGAADDELISALGGVAQEGPYLPTRETLWPRSALFRLEFSEAALSHLAELSDRRATPELVDHLHVYTGPDERLYWPDAFLRGSRLYVSPAVPRESVLSWADSMGVEVKREGG